MSAAAPGEERGAYFWMDCLRFCAALAVVAEHARDLLVVTSHEAGSTGAGWKAFYFLTGFGHEAVMVFFVLSGFWITSAIDRRAGRADFWPQYLVDRLSRLMAVIVPGLLIGAALDLASLGVHSPYALGQSGALTLQESIAPHLTVGAFVGNLLFLQTVAVPTFGSNGPLWSLANEFWYYIWFPALLLTWRNRRPSFALAAFAIAFVAPRFLEGFAVWLMGSALYYFDKRSAGTAGRFPGLILAAASGLLALALAASRLQHLGAAADLVVGTAFALFLWALLRASPSALTLAKPAARFGAAASFSFYAIHMPMVMLIATLLPPGGRTLPDLARLSEFLGVVLAILIIARIFAFLTEGQTARLRQALRARLPQRPAAGSAWS